MTRVTPHFSTSKRSLLRFPRADRYAGLPGAGPTSVLLDVNPAHYGSADSVFDVSGTNPGTFSKTSAPTVSARNGHRALYLDGVDDKLYLALANAISDLSSGALTVYMVSEPTGLDGTNEYPFELSGGAAASTNPRVFSGFHTTGSPLAVNYNDAGSFSQISSGVDGVGLTSNRQPLVTAFELSTNATTRRLYVNGELHTDTTTTALDLDGAGLNGVHIGTNAGSFEGYLYRVLVVRDAYSDTLNDYLLSTYAAQDVAWTFGEQVANTGNAGADESLVTYYLPPHTLTEDGDWLEIEYVGRSEATSTGSFRIDFNGSNASAQVGGGGALELKHRTVLMRTSPTTAVIANTWVSSAGTTDFTPATLTGIDWTDAIPIEFIAIQSGGTGGETVAHWGMVRSHKVRGTRTIDAHLPYTDEGATTSAEGEVTLATLTIPAGTLTEASPLVMAEGFYDKTGSATTSTAFKLDLNGTTQTVATTGGAADQWVEVWVWRVDASNVGWGYTVTGTPGSRAFNYVGSAAVAADSTDLTLSLISDIDSAGAGSDTMAVPRACAHAWQPILAAVDVSAPSNSAGTNTDVTGLQVSGIEETDEGGGFRMVSLSKCAASVAGGTMTHWTLNGSGAKFTGYALSVGTANLEVLGTSTHFRDSASTSTQQGQFATRTYTSGFSPGAALYEAGAIDADDWEATDGSDQATVATNGADAGDVTFHLWYVERLRQLYPGNAPNAPVDVAWADATERGNVSTTETDATVYYLPPNTLTADGDWLEIESATKRNTTGSHVQKFYFGGSARWTRTIDNTGIEEIEDIRVIRTSSTTASFYAGLRTSAGSKSYDLIVDMTGLDFTDAIEVKTTLTGAAATDDLTQHYFRVRSHKVAANLTLDVDAAGGTTSGTSETTLATLTVPRGRLTAARPVAIAEVWVEQTASASFLTYGVELNGNAATGITNAPTSNKVYLYTVTAWRVDASTVAWAAGWVGDNGLCDFAYQGTLAIASDDTDLTIALKVTADDGADSATVDAYTAHVRQVDCLEVDATGGSNDGIDTNDLWRLSVDPGTDENGKGTRARMIGAWAASPNTSGSFRALGSEGITFLTNTDDASAHDDLEAVTFRTGSAAEKGFGLRWRGATAIIGLDETENTVLSWSDPEPGFGNQLTMDAGDFTWYLAYAEALP